LNVLILDDWAGNAVFMAAAPQSGSRRKTTKEREEENEIELRRSVLFRSHRVRWKDKR